MTDGLPNDVTLANIPGMFSRDAREAAEAIESTLDEAFRQLSKGQRLDQPQFSVLKVEALSGGYWHTATVEIERLADTGDSVLMLSKQFAKLAVILAGMFRPGGD